MALIHSGERNAHVFSHPVDQAACELCALTGKKEIGVVEETQKASACTVVCQNGSRLQNALVREKHNDSLEM